MDAGFNVIIAGCIVPENKWISIRNEVRETLSGFPKTYYLRSLKLVVVYIYTKCPNGVLIPLKIYKKIKG